MSEIRGLSVRQPWSWAICAGVKLTENRTWTTEIRGTIAIHASSSAQVVNSVLRGGGKELPSKDWFTFGAIIGLADIVDIASYGPQHEQDPFAEGPYCWTMANGRFLKEPIPLKGKLNLFKIDAEIQDQLRSAETIVTELASDPVAAAVAQAMTPAPEPAQSYLELIQEFQATGNHQNVIPIACDRLIDLDPSEPTGYQIRGILRLYDPIAIGASADLQRAVELDPTNEFSWYYLADAYRKEKDFAKAFDTADQLVQLSPTSKMSLECRARARFNLSRFAEALSDCDAALGLAPGDVITLALRAQVKSAVGDHAGAMSDLDEAMRTSPDDASLVELRQKLEA